MSRQPRTNSKPSPETPGQQASRQAQDIAHRAFRHSLPQMWTPGLRPGSSDGEHLSVYSLSDAANLEAYVGKSGYMSKLADRKKSTNQNDPWNRIGRELISAATNRNLIRYALTQERVFDIWIVTEADKTLPLGGIMRAAKLRDSVAVDVVQYQFTHHPGFDVIAAMHKAVIEAKVGE